MNNGFRDDTDAIIARTYEGIAKLNKAVAKLRDYEPMIARIEADIASRAERSAIRTYFVCGKTDDDVRPALFAAGERGTAE
jgi:hypothetical protein